MMFFKFYAPILPHILLFSILVVLLPIEKSIIILMSPLCMFALFGEVLFTCVYISVRAFTCFIDFFLPPAIIRCFQKRGRTKSLCIYVVRVYVTLYARFRTVRVIVLRQARRCRKALPTLEMLLITSRSAFYRHVS
uniref:Uncharacterized protein n=1 Tax=Rhipicephalus microplus TaxID=6941 RepID=A0A6G5AG53_RHIMP